MTIIEVAKNAHVKAVSMHFFDLRGTSASYRQIFNAVLLGK